MQLHIVYVDTYICMYETVLQSGLYWNCPPAPWYTVILSGIFVIQLTDPEGPYIAFRQLAFMEKI